MDGRTDRQIGNESSWLSWAQERAFEPVGVSTNRKKGNAIHSHPCSSSHHLQPFWSFLQFSKADRWGSEAVWENDNQICPIFFFSISRGICRIKSPSVSIRTPIRSRSVYVCVYAYFLSHRLLLQIPDLNRSLDCTSKLHYHKELLLNSFKTLTLIEKFHQPSLSEKSLGLKSSRPFGFKIWQASKSPLGAQKLNQSHSGVVISLPPRLEYIMLYGLSSLETGSHKAFSAGSDVALGEKVWQALMPHLPNN